VQPPAHLRTAAISHQPKPSVSDAMDKQTTLFAMPETSPKVKTSQEPLCIFIDGAARGNPGPAGAGIFMQQGKKTVLAEGLFLGKKTNNQAEYLALLLALLLVNKLFKDKKISPTSLRFFSDSELLVKQMNGIYQVKNEQLKVLRMLILTQLQPHKATFAHVFREQNTQADALANEGVDKKKKPPASIANLLADHGIAL
jgi:ribonuclease HI